MMTKKDPIESRHAYLYWERIARDTNLAASQLLGLDPGDVAPWTPQQLTVLDDLRQAGRRLTEAAESLIEECSDR